MAVGSVARPVLTAPYVVLGIPLNVVADQEVKVAVLIVVKPPGAGGPPSFITNTRLLSDIGKSTVAIVVVQDGAAVSGHVKIRIAVVVIVADRYTLPVETSGADARLFRDVSKRAVTVVVIKGGAQRARRLVDVGGRRLNEEEVHQA